MTPDGSDFTWPELDDRAGPAAPIVEADARRLVQDAMRARSIVVPRRRPRIVFAAAAAMLAGATALAWVGGVRLRPRADVPPQAPPASAPPPLAAPAQATRPPSAHDAPAPLETTTLAAPARERPGSAPAAPEDLLARANALRSERRWSEAADAYMKVVRAAPASPAAQAARVAAGDLLLEQLGDPRRAERRFGEAERAGGPLAEEAAWGVVRARRARGDREGERAALDAFLRHFPSGVMADAARARQAELASGR